MEDHALLEAWRQGDRTAGQALVAKYYEGVLRFFTLRTRFAQDLTQRTFLAVVESKERFRGDSSFRSYLYGIARYQLLRHIDEASRHERLASFDSPQGNTMTSLSTIVARRQEQHALLRAIVDLPVDTQVLLGLYYWESMPTTEIAVVLEARPSTVGTWLSRARSELKAKLRRSSKAWNTSKPPGMSEEDALDHWMRSLANHGAWQGKVPAVPVVAAAVAPHPSGREA